MHTYTNILIHDRRQWYVDIRAVSSCLGRKGLQKHASHTNLKQKETDYDPAKSYYEVATQLIQDFKVHILM
jgi:hypothetical protein